MESAGKAKWEGVAEERESALAFAKEQMKMWAEYAKEANAKKRVRASETPM
jgi:hypothetical protein